MHTTEIAHVNENNIESRIYKENHRITREHKHPYKHTYDEDIDIRGIIWIGTRPPFH